MVNFEGVTKGYDDRVLIEDLNLILPPGGIIGVIGPNGAGKTTLLRMITGQEAPDAGKITVGSTVELAYVDQSRDDLRAEATVWEEISDGLEQLRFGNRDLNSRAYVASFNFQGTDQQKKVGNLSGGERNRVHLAKMLKRGANVLLLDEPTNDLDVNTLRALEESSGELRGLRHRRLPRPLVPGPHRHPHPRLRGGREHSLVRGELQRLRGGPEEAAGAGGGDAASVAASEVAAVAWIESPCSA